MNAKRILNSWLGRPAKTRRSLGVERLDDRITPTVNDKALAVPVDLATLSTTQDLIALTPSNKPMTDLANAVNHLNLGNTVNLSSSGVVLNRGESTLVRIALQSGIDARAAAATLYSTGLYSFVSPNYVYPPGLAGRSLKEAVPNDPQYPAQFPHPIIDTPRGWDTTFGSSSVIIAILDDGVDISHTDLQANVLVNSGEIAGDGIDNDGNGYIDDRFGYDFLSNNGNVFPDDPLQDPHGTQIAGVLAGRLDNGLGIAGVAGRASFLPLKVIGNAATTSLSIARAVSYAIERGAKIINSSLNIDPFVNDPAFQTAVSAAYDSGLLWVNSAGNLNLQDPARARFDNMLIVGATDRGDVKTSYSNYGWGLDLVAPGGADGDGVLTTMPGGGYGLAFGTSISTPLVAGTAALIWSANPGWTRDQVASALLAVAQDIDAQNPNYLDKLGTGRLDAGESVSGGSFVTRLGRIYDMPGPGQDAPPGFDSFRLRLLGNLDPGTVTTANFELRWAGNDNTFDTGDDNLVSLSLKDGYQFGTNSLDFTIHGTLDRGLYRFTAKSGGLRDPFNTPVDGDGNGTAGGNLVRYFGSPIRVRGNLSVDIDGSGGTSPGDPPPPPGGGVFPDFNNNGIQDATSFPNQGGAVAIPDDPNSSATVNIPASGFTRPVNYLQVQILITHAVPSDLVMTLIAPNGLRVTLFANRPLPGGPSAANQLFIFEDGVPENTTITPNLITRKLNPDQPLSSLYGIDANGVWQVEVVDTTPGDSGTLISAHVTIGEEPLIRPDANGDFVLGDLPSNTTVRILPPAGYELIPSSKTVIYKTGDYDRDPLLNINASLRPVAGMIGRVTMQDGSGVPGISVSIDGGPSATTDGNGYYSLTGLAPGTYFARVLPKPGFSVPNSVRGAILTSQSPLSTGNDFSVVRDVGPVRVDLPPVTPTLRTATVKTIAFTLGEPVDGLGLSNLVLTRNGVSVSLADATLIGSGTQFTLIGLESATGLDGNYALTIYAPAPVGQPGRASLPTTTTWTLDTTPPTVTVTPVVGSHGVVDVVTLSFNSPVNGLDLSDFILKRGTIVVPLSNTILSPGTTLDSYVLSGLAGVATPAGSYTLELKPGITDAAGNAIPNSTVIAWTVPPRPVRYTAVAAGEGISPTVSVLDVNGKVVRMLTPYDLSYTGGVRVATGDVNGDLVDDIIVAPGRNSGPRVRVYDGATGLVISDFFAFETNFRGGLFVSAGDVTGDGIAEIIVTPDKSGGPRVRVLDGITAKTVADFFGIEDVNFRGGARTALGDVTGDGRLDVIVSAGTGGGPRVAVFDGVSVAGNSPSKPFGDFLAFEAGLRNGAYVAAMDLNGDGRAEIIAGAGDGGGPRLTAFSGADLMNNQYVKLSDFFVGDLSSRGGLRLAVEDVNDDGTNELFVGPGAGVMAKVRVYAAPDLLAGHSALRELDLFNGFLGGVFIG